jgi:MFS family permease
MAWLCGLSPLDSASTAAFSTHWLICAGVVLAVAQVCRFLGGLVFGRVADKTGRFRGVLLGTNLVSVALALSTTSLLSPWHGMHGWKRVVVLALLTDGYAFFTSPSGTLIDAIAVVSQTSGGASYGSLRLWAAIGWGLAAVGMGAGVDRYGFSSVFIAYAIGTALSSALVVACFENPNKPSRADDTAAASLASVFLVAPVPLYFLNFFIHGCLAAFVESYLLLFVATEWPATPNWFLGLLILIAAVFEIPVFLYANRVIERVGVRPCLVGAQLLFALRCTAYATLARRAKSTHGYLWFVLLEPTHALTFAMMWSAAVEYARRAAPPERQGTAQALVRGAYYYLGVGTGSVVAGRIIRARGYEFLYEVGASAMIAWAAVWEVLLAASRGRRPADSLREGLLDGDVS